MMEEIKVENGFVGEGEGAEGLKKINNLNAYSVERIFLAILCFIFLLIVLK